MIRLLSNVVLLIVMTCFSIVSSRFALFLWWRSKSVCCLFRACTYSSTRRVFAPTWRSWHQRPEFQLHCSSLSIAKKSAACVLKNPCICPLLCAVLSFSSRQKYAPEKTSARGIELICAFKRFRAWTTIVQSRVNRCWRCTPVHVQCISVVNACSLPPKVKSLLCDALKTFVCFLLPTLCNSDRSSARCCVAKCPARSDKQLRHYTQQRHKKEIANNCRPVKFNFSKALTLVP